MFTRLCPLCAHPSHALIRGDRLLSEQRQLRERRDREDREREERAVREKSCREEEELERKAMEDKRKRNAVAEYQ